MAGELLLTGQRTPSLRSSQLDPRWFIVDAEGLVLGRLASHLAMVLRGKHKATYSPGMDCGDKVIVINAAKIGMTGDKPVQRLYWHHTGYPGGIRSTRAIDIQNGPNPERLLFLDVKRMMGQTPLSRAQLRNLRIYAGADHPHEGTTPGMVEFASYNPKNSLRSLRKRAMLVRGKL